MRVDKFFSQEFGSRTKAAEAAEKGLIFVNGKRVKPKDEVSEGDDILLLREKERFVSNGGYKLARALEIFALDCNNKIFVDIGASTGGFTDCLLQNGAKKVYAVDVGTSQLCDSLRVDDRVVSMENTNARYLQSSDFKEQIDGVVSDVSFISLTLIFPVISSLLSEKGESIVLIKPQFECERKHISKSGIVQLQAHPKIVEKVLESAKTAGLYPFGIVNAPVRKGKNIEYVVHFKKTEKNCLLTQKAVEKVKLFCKQHTDGCLE